ncbi:MAG: DUF1461 domain-containing protein [Pseudomonadales bacterium]|nr:DUF1461 domain-containing protein [Pseudomonadales bacterium]
MTNKKSKRQRKASKAKKSNIANPNTEKATQPNKTSGTASASHKQTPSWFAIALWPVVFISQLIVAALISWHLLAQFDFAYSAAYDSIDIEKHIKTFGPRNRYRPEFETTTPEDHHRLFAEIGDAIQNHGEGLADISYQTSKGQTYTLLRSPEVIHLQDVANLVDVFYSVGYVCIGLLLLGCALAYVKQLSFPGAKHISIGIVAFVATVAGILFGVGPRKVFYWLHVQIFPPEHEWFFYYQDSLMTTLMKAPDLFGFIGAVMGFVLMLVWIAEIILLRLLLKKAQQA